MSLRLILCAALALGGCKRTVTALDAGAPVTVRTRTVRAPVTLTLAAPESPSLEAACEAAFAEVERLDDVLSDWRGSSELVKLNQHAGKGPLAVSPELFALLERARGLSEASGGAFDPTFASLYGLWSFKADAPRIPTNDELAERLPLVGYQALKLDSAARTAEIARAGTRIGLGSISDGYAAFRASAVLTAKGFPDHLVLIGGDGGARGRRLDRPWRVGIRHPETGGIWATLELRDEGVATSGNYQKFFLKDGVRYHHILDPKTGYPARGSSAVTVVAKDAMQADGWATTLFVLGPVKGLEVAQRHHLEALWFDEAFVVSGTPGILARVQRTAQP